MHSSKKKEQEKKIKKNSKEFPELKGMNYTKSLGQ